MNMTCQSAPEDESQVSQRDIHTADRSMDDRHDIGSELSALGEIVRLLPAGVTVQDEHGRFLLVNDAAAAQLKISTTGFCTAPPDAPASKEVSLRRENGIEMLRSGRQVVVEECVSDSQGERIFLTAHRPMHIADRNLLLSSSVDISEQKAFEDELFRHAFYDELTGLPNRRVMEKRANDLIRDGAGRFALAFLDIDNFKHINDYYGHAIGDALLVEVAKRLGLDLRETDMLSRISGDEFLLLLSPVQNEQEVAEYIEFLLQRLRAVLCRGLRTVRIGIDRRQSVSGTRPQL